MIKGYKLNLQNFIGTRVPTGILNLFFKFRYSRNVSMQSTRVYDLITSIKRKSSDGRVKRGMNRFVLATIDGDK